MSTETEGLSLLEELELLARKIVACGLEQETGE